MSVITEFSKSTGLLRAGAGYVDISSYRVEDLISVLQGIKPGTEVRLAAVPYFKKGKKRGNALLIKSRKETEPNWIYVTPMKGDEKRYPESICEFVTGDET